MKSIYITSLKFYDDFTELSGGGANFLQGCVGDRIRVVMDFYAYRAFTKKRFSFVDGGPSDYSSMAFTDEYDRDNFRARGFAIGQNVTIVGTPSNDGEYAIADISEDGRTLYFDETFVEELGGDDVAIYDTTDVTALDLFYNLIANNDTENYASLVDNGTLQRFAFAGLNASDAFTPVKGAVASKSYAWVTNPISDELTGETIEVSIVGAGVEDYKQKFTLTQYFLITPTWRQEFLSNLANATTPDLWDGGSALKYVYRLDGFYDTMDAEPGHTSAEDFGVSPFADGINSWFDTSIKGARPEYYVDSVVYTVDGDIVDVPDLNKDGAIVVRIKSRSGRFVDETGGPTPIPGTRFELSMLYCPIDTDRYQDTTRTMRQNFFWDRAAFQIGDVAANGDQYGTDYALIAGATAAFVDDETVTIAFSFQSSDAFKEFMRATDAADRNFLIFLTTQNLAVTSTRTTDREATLVDFNEFAYDQDDASLVDMPEGIIADEFPFEGENTSSDVAGYESDPVFVRIPFRVQQGVGGECKSIIVFSGDGSFTWSMIINGSPLVPTPILFNSADLAGSLASLAAALEADHPGFTGSFVYVGASQTWTVTITTPTPGGAYEGIQPLISSDIGIGGSINVGLFELVADTDLTRPVVKTITVAIIATKTDRDDFTLESKTVDLSSVRIVGGAQEIDIAETRGFNAPEDAHENRFEIFRRSDLDNANLRGYEIQYGTILRYEYWRQALAIFDATGIDIFKDITDVTDEWANYDVHDWSLVLRTTIVVTGYDGHDTEFFADTPVRVLSADENPDAAPIFTDKTVEYFGLDPDTNEYTVSLDCVNKDAPTLVRATFGCDFSALPGSATGIYGLLRMDQPVVGSVFGSRLATTERDSEDESPWSAPDADPDAFASYANGNARLNVYKSAGNYSAVVVESILDPADLADANVVIYPRVGFKYITS